jgi:pimeloyl-ACP methyl ester carboxylesterase
MFRSCCRPSHTCGGGPQPRPIEEARFLLLGGIQQWITIRAADGNKPVLLILHGGPGEAQSPLVSTYAPLEHSFVVVQWDQRGAGKTLGHAGAFPQSTSLELLAEDGIELAEYLKTYLHTNGVVLVGHSWGSFLGVHMVKGRPDLFRAFVGTGHTQAFVAAIGEDVRLLSR